jgi:large subunit ribosomal protein L29
MAVSELATMEPGELADRLADARKELFNLRFQLATGQLDNSARVRHVRKEVARILTYLRQQELADLEGAALGEAAVDAAGTAAHEDEEDS